MNKFQELISRQICEQQTEKWYETRHNIITASNVSSILEANPYLTKVDLLKEKCKKYTESKIDNNIAKKWGINYEQVAIKIYEELYEEEITKIGLIIHKEYEWLGASPDGLRKSSKLLEIKNIWNRRIITEIPLYYWIQVQIQLEVCDINECDLFQCKIIEYDNEEEYKKDINAIKKGYYNGKYWKLEKYYKHTIYRDKKWFMELALPQLKQFWEDIKIYSKNNKLIKKRKRNEENENNEKNKRMKYMEHDWENWIQSTETKNYILRDTIIDWLNIYGKEYKMDNQNYMNETINKMEKEFKEYVIKYLMEKYDTVYIGNHNEKYSIQKANMTIEEIKKGTPIIINGIIHNYENKTYGIVDLIVRGDYLNRITNKEIKEDGYRIVQIKYGSIEINNDNIVNNIKIKTYKSEIIINNNGLGKIIGYEPKNGYIISRKWKIDNKKYGWNEYIGKIDTTEEKIIEETKNGIKWIKELKKNGKKMTINDFYPNISNKIDYPWHNIKRDIAEKKYEITLLWNCGYRERNILHSHGIYEWTNIDVKLLGFNENKSKILNAIIEVNKSDKKIINNNKICIKYKNIFYIDFETVNDIGYIDDNIKNMIFMIGVGYIDKDEKWISKTFIVKRLEKKYENEIIEEWIKYMNGIVNNDEITLCHWSNAERIMLKNVEMPSNIKWFDLLEYYKMNNIAIKGAYNYGLKEIANACYKNGLINIKWEDNDVTGTKAIITALNCNKNLGKNDKLEDCMEMIEIIKYNEIDFKVLKDLYSLVS